MSVSAAAHRLARPDAGWFLSLYPTAGEAGGAFVSSVRRGGPIPVAGSGADPVRARNEAARRARAKVRRYCSANRLNRLNRLGTLTYAGSGCHDPLQIRADIGAFFRRLRHELGRGSFPYVWIPEWHKTDHGLHVHFAVGQFVPRGVIQLAWGRGFVHIKRLSDLPVGSTSLRESRRAAGYLSKYVSKTFQPGEREHLLGLNRYGVGHGFQPRVMRLSGRSSSQVLDKAQTVMGGPPAQSWSSQDSEDWQGPPAVWFD